jgi:hypothetical protein
MFGRAAHASAGDATGWLPTRPANWFALVAMFVILSVTLAPSRVSAQVRVARYVSTSGIPHHDVGNYTKSAFWQRGDPRGMPDHSTWRASIDHVLGRIKAEAPNRVFFTGDMVSGRWGVDVDRTGIFGPVGTLTQRKAAVRRAGDLYYRQNKSWWAANGISPNNVHFAIGDHEYGDVDRGAVRPHQLDLVADHRAIWHRHFVSGRGYRRLTEGQQQQAAYATAFGGVGLVSLDPILKQDGDLIPRIGEPQMRWLEETLRNLRNEGRELVIVQVEIPARGPNRSEHSSDLILQNGQAVWDLLVEYGVDLLLSAEFHTVTTHSNGGRTPVQIVHGDQMYRAQANYLVIDRFADGHLELTLKAMGGTRAQLGAFWAPASQRAPGVLRMNGPVRVIGRATVTPRGDLVGRSGFLREGL